jgi:hypothetical protein
LQRARHQAQRACQIAALQLDKPEPVQRLEVVGPDRKNLGLKLFRLRQLPLAVEVERLLDGLGNVESFGVDNSAIVSK